VQRLLTALRNASKPTLWVASLALLGLAAGGAYVALAAPKLDKPKITAGPGTPTNQTSAAFTYSSKTSVAFLCSLDGGGYVSCGSGTSGARSYAGPIAPGVHSFRVAAQSGATTTDPAVWTWTIDTTPPPAPTIVNHPADPTDQTSAAFSQADSETGVDYQCKLDGGSFQSCGGGKSYSGLALGGHTYQVKALDKAGNASGPTSFSWTIVPPAPPKPKITSQPADPTNQTSAAFAYTDARSVTFLCSLDGGAYAGCGNGTSGSTTYAGPLADGVHTFLVKAQQGGSAASSADSRTWTVDATPPPAPSFTETPSSPTTEKKATFRFGDSEAGVTFQCRLDAGSYAKCGSPRKYSNLGEGPHTFCVQALDRAGNLSTPACYTWQVGAGAAAFTIAGAPLPGTLLYPGGPAVAVNLAFTNPNSSSITIQSVTVSVTGTSVPACAGTNFTVAHQLSATPTIPASSTRSLQDLGVPQSDWPKLQMTGSGNQDACQSATVNLAFTGTATG